MRVRFRKIGLAAIAAFSTTLLPAPFTEMAAAQTAQSQSALKPDQLYSIARDAYLFAYPLVTMDATMHQATNVPDSGAVVMRAPINQFAHVRTYPDADERDVVRWNFDTLYSLAWADVSREPIVLSVPDTEGRYYLLQMLDMWSDVFSVVGARTTGTKPGNYAIVPVGWSGELPAGVHKIVAPTSTFWILGRTQTNGPADYGNVHEVQDGYTLTPLSQWGTNYVPPRHQAVDPGVDNSTPPLIQVNKLDGVAMLTRLAALMQKYPPHANDYPMLFRLRALGIEPGKPFDSSRLDPQTIAIVNQAAADTLRAMPDAMRRGGEKVNGWNIGRDNMGSYGTSYLRRALIAMGGLGANLPEDAIYPVAFVDADGKTLQGANRYVLHFAKEQLPPANAFWSITMYDNHGFQIPNPINRFALGSHDKLTFNADGSLDIYVENKSPGKERESNWLPAPLGSFQPTMRLYSPKFEALDGRWSPPPFVRVD